MSTRLYRYLQISVITATLIFLLQKVISGELSWYINPRFLPLTFTGIIILAIMTLGVFRQTRKDQTDHEHIHIRPGGLVMLLLPILAGIFLPNRPLDAAAVDSKGITVSAPLVSADASRFEFEAAPDQRNVLDWIRIFSSESDLSPYIGQEASVIGFVYYAEDLPENQFLVSRFIITCCAADGFALGVPVEWDGEKFNENDWVTVKGPVELTDWYNMDSPLIIATSVEPTTTPDQPYLFP